MVLLLTGAIDIRDFNVPSTIIVDVNERLSQYLDSIDYAITHYKTISEIVFCENTNFNYDYTKLQEKALKNGKNLEIISFGGDYSTIQQKGKGYGEGEIIKYALNKSEILRQCDVFLKLTGRLILKNTDKITATSSLDSIFIYHPKTIGKIPRDHIETFFYKVDKNLYIKYLIDAHQQVDESQFQYLEHIFYKQISSLNIQSFKLVPLISGFSGSTGLPYDLKPKNLLLEKINYYIGVHNLKKTIIERVMTFIISNLLKITRLFN